MEGGKRQGDVNNVQCQLLLQHFTQGQLSHKFIVEGLDPNMYESLAKIGLYTTDLILYEPEY